MTPVEEVTGFPEVLDGRVKTLHPRVHAGLLADLRKPEHAAALEELGIAAVRTGGGQPVSVQRDRRLRCRRRRVRRADRHRRTVDGPGRREEPSERRGRGRPARLRRRAGRGARRRLHPRRAEKAGVVGISAHRRVRRRGGELDGVDAGARGAAPARCRSGSGAPGAALRCCATARTRISRPRSTATTARGRAWLRPSSCTEKRCPTTTSPTRTRRGGRRSTTKRPAWRSSSTPTRAGSRSRRSRWPMRTARPTSAIR